MCSLMESQETSRPKHCSFYNGMAQQPAGLSGRASCQQSSIFPPPRQSTQHPAHKVQQSSTVSLQGRGQAHLRLLKIGGHPLGGQLQRGLSGLVVEPHEGPQHRSKRLQPPVSGQARLHHEVDTVSCSSSLNLWATGKRLEGRDAVVGGLVQAFGNQAMQELAC